MITLETITGSREPWIPLLIEADDSESVVRRYLDRGELCAIRDGSDDVGVALLLREGQDVEIKAFAVAEDQRGRGVGRTALELIASRVRSEGASRLVVGTANSSIDNLRFYQRCGFRISGVVTGYFDDYPEPIWEFGIRARDLVLFAMEL